MKKLVILILFFIPSIAYAQTQMPPSGQEQIERTIGSLIINNANLQSQLIQANNRITDLQKQIEDLKSKDTKNDSNPSKN